jgi:hypothetical protein
MTSRYRFLSCHATKRTLLHPNLQLDSPSWSWTVRGNGTFAARIAVPEDKDLVDRLKGATEPLVAAVYVQDRNNEYPWGGPVIKRTWLPGKSSIAITCMEWRAWLFSIQYLPSATQDFLFSASPASGQEQLALARALVFAATGGGGANGCPPYTTDSNVSTKLRELNFYTTQSKKIGELLDTMSSRDNGFEWTFLSRRDAADGLPRLHLSLAWPEASSFRSTLKFKATSGGSNFKPDAVDLDASAAVNSFLATGSGTPPDMLFAYDSDAYDISTNSVLRIDGAGSYNTVVDRATLASHARRAILFFREGVQTISGSHTFGEIDPDAYNVGDRVPLLVADRWDRLELPAVRVTEKTVDLSGAGSVKFRLDLSDATLPEVDAGGAI